MSALRNSVRLTGYLGQDPDVFTFGENQKMIRVSMATHERYKNKEDEWKTDTHWHQLTFWGRIAGFAEKTLKKGDQVIIEGRLVNNNFVDKEGVARQSSEIVVNELLLIRSKSEELEAQLEKGYKDVKGGNDDKNGRYDEGAEDEEDEEEDADEEGDKE